jgi:hypothetical protein
VPLPLSEFGGGVANGYNAVKQLWEKFRKRPAHTIDTSGPYWLAQQNHANITQGFSDGLAASKPPSPFIEYGYGPSARRAAGQIGDGNGTAEWISSLAGIDPKEPPQHAWPPQADRPIRYLGRRTQ